jgi:hypothetical protein
VTSHCVVSKKVQVLVDSHLSGKPDVQRALSLDSAERQLCHVCS